MWFYKDGKLVVETDVVTGNERKKWGTDLGVFKVNYKQRNTRLKGPGYNVKVKYWIPYNKGEGLHDASWRGTFGGQIYKKNGSHGCVNTPTAAMAIIFEQLNKGDTVVVYKE